MARRLEFFFDYGSPYSYLADTQLGALVERTGAELVYRPMLLGGVFKATGNRSPAFEPIEAKRAYGGVEMRRWIEHLGVPFHEDVLDPYGKGQMFAGPGDPNLFQRGRFNNHRQ